MPKRPQLAELLKRMDARSIAIIPSANEVLRNQDTHYRFRQNSDFYYLTGFDEPESIAVLDTTSDKPLTLYVRPRDPAKEAWDGARAGVEGAKDVHGADESFPINEFKDKLLETLNGKRTLYYPLGANRELDDQIIATLKQMRLMSRKYSAPISITDPSAIVHEMRMVKSDEEIALMERAAQITAEAHTEAMQQTKPGMNEYEIEALIDYEFRKRGATAPAYGSIVGGGNNATVLHYVKNDEELKDGDLLLLDAGAEYKGYAADITRTFPVNGKFTDAQRDIYELVLKAEMECVERARSGTSFDELYNHSAQVLTEGMVRLGILTGDPSKLIEEKAHEKYYMHRLGHFLGMDVHDVGAYNVDDKARALEPGMILTIEPGLYFTNDAEDVPEKYRGIGVRIEDDVLITKDGNRVLTGDAPKQVEEVEALMAQGK